MKKNAIILLILLGFSVSVFAQNVISINAAKQVIQAHSNDSEKQWVQIKGRVEQINRSKYYLLKDSSGELFVEIEKKALQGISIKVGDTLLVFGKLEWEKNSVQVEAKMIQKGDSNVFPFTTSNQINRMSDDTWVKIKGRISKSDRQNYYLLSDEYGFVTVKIQYHDGGNIIINDGDIFTIYGEVEQELRSQGQSSRGRNSYLNIVEAEYIEKN